MEQIPDDEALKKPIIDFKTSEFNDHEYKADNGDRHQLEKRSLRLGLVLASLASLLKCAIHLAHFKVVHQPLKGIMTLHITYSVIILNL